MAQQLPPDPMTAPHAEPTSTAAPPATATAASTMPARPRPAPVAGASADPDVPAVQPAPTPAAAATSPSPSPSPRSEVRSTSKPVAPPRMAVAAPTPVAPTPVAPPPAPAPPAAAAEASATAMATSLLATYQIRDPDAFARNLVLLVEHGTRAWGELVERADAKPGPYSPAAESANATEAMMTLLQAWTRNPTRFAEEQAKLFTAWAGIWNGAMRRAMGEQVPPVVTPAPGDNRFKDPEWAANPYFDFWKQFYLVTSNWAERQLEQTEVDERTRQRLAFYLRLVSSAMSPANVPAMNPEVLRETFERNGENLVQGMMQLAEDMQRSGDLLQIRQTDVDAFRVGENLALTPGKIVFENDLFQLIQYTPTTLDVCETPLLIVPPWINKYYILDLTPPRSLIRYAVSQGITVFVVSWVNPDERLAHKTFEDYMLEGVLAADQAVKRETGAPKTNILGYCVGGTLVASTLSYLAAIGQEPFAAATFLTTQVDFEKAGDLLVFIDNEQLDELQQIMRVRGYLDGSRMANVFNMMRPKDLIWPYVINNYMLGRKPMPFDLLYWNQDSTRMTATNHDFYLREFYNENRLAKAEMTLAGQRLDPRRVTLPIYDLATREDHIAPAVSVFKGARLFSGPVEFVLAGSGHIAGVINPPEKVKYQYWTGPKPADADALEPWMGRATEHPGSWWPHWIGWLKRHSGNLVPARPPGQRLGVIEDAPGRYVQVRCARAPTDVKSADDRAAAE